ncbi:hypothetical protein SO802_029768 [Lithocarpus litseifolius]|uniref:CCHC-type domain-containing protein n=1 Tax=Lithocarpus litseifolius TaxID=425828 RepID=A0AAW2BU97_9ROSI
MGVLKEIRNAIGPVLQINAIIANAIVASGTQGRYVRICVQVDLAKPLVRKVLIGRIRQEVLYKGISSLCFACERMGHRKEVCPYVAREAMVDQDLKANGGLEPLFSVNTEKQEAGVSSPVRPGLARLGKPLVEISNGHPVQGGRKNSGVESAVTKFAGANFAKIKATRGDANKENVRKPAFSNKFDGVFRSHHSDPNVWGKVSEPPS